MTDPASQAVSIVNSTVGMADELEAIQRASFPTLAEGELITAAHYRVGTSSAFRKASWPPSPRPAGRSPARRTSGRRRTSITSSIVIDAVDHNWLGRHDPDGDWLYGADIGVVPEYRRRGIARLLYGARHALVRRLNLRGTSRAACSGATACGRTGCLSTKYVAGGRRPARRSDAHRAAPVRLPGARDHPELRYRPLVRQQGGVHRLAQSRVPRRAEAGAPVARPGAAAGDPGVRQASWRLAPPRGVRRPSTR